MARKHVEAYIIALMNRLTTTPLNADIYQKRFKAMSDQQFKTWVESLIEGRSKLAAWLPNDGTNANLEECLVFARELNYEFFQRLRVNETATVPGHLTAVKHMVCLVPMRRQAQTFSKKVSVAKDDKRVDALSGQPVDPSSPTSMSAPETRLLAGIGLKYTAREFTKIRGGDVGAYRAYRSLIETNGTVSQAAIEPYATGVGSLKNLRAWLLGKHIGTNI